MKFLKSLLQFWWYIFLGTIIRPWYKFFKSWVGTDVWINNKLSDWNYFKINKRGK